MSKSKKSQINQGFPINLVNSEAMRNNRKQSLGCELSQQLHTQHEATGTPEAERPSAERPVAGRPKSQQKRIDILFAASELFLEHGFSSTSMDMVAQQAGVSKQTVYSHFNNKDTLFTSVIDYKCKQHQLDKDHMRDNQQLPFEAFLQIGHQLMNLLQDPQVVAMHRVVIGEVATTPRVAELFFQAGPQNGLLLLSQFMRDNVHLNLDEQQANYFSCAFFNLLKGDFHIRSLLGLTYELSPQEQMMHVKTATQSLMAMIQAQS